MSSVNPFALYLAQQEAKKNSQPQDFGVTETTIPGGVSMTGAQPAQQPAQQNTQQPTSYTTNPDAWVNQYYEGYDPNAGLTTIGSNGSTTISHKKTSPETHPWLYINPGEVDVNGRIYHNSDGSPLNYAQTGTGYTAGRQATEQERQASYDSNNYFKTGEGLDPRLLEAMTRYITPGQTPGNEFSNQFGKYTQQHAIMDPNRIALGLDPWVEIASRFSGTDQEGNPVNYNNSSSLWGNRGPGFHGGLPGNVFERPGGSGYSGPTPAGRNDPDWMSKLPESERIPASQSGSGGRAWGNLGSFIDRSTGPGDYGEVVNGTQTGNPGMAALKAAMMKNPWGQ